MSAGLRGEARIGGGVLVRAKRYVVAASAVALAVSGAIVSASPASAASCPTVLPDGTVLPAPVNVWFGCDLDGADLDGFVINTSLHGSTLVGASLRGASLRGINIGVLDQLPAADLTDADLTDADLTLVQGYGADLSGATLDGAQLANTSLTATVVAGTHLGTARLTGATVGVANGTPASLPLGWVVAGTVLAGPGADLSWLTLEHPVFTGGSLAGADLHLATINGGVFDGVDLTGADFRHTWLGDSDFTGALNFDKASWDGAWTTGIVCPDGVASYKHDGGDCTRNIDVVAPVVSVTGADQWGLGRAVTWPVATVENGSGLGDGRSRSRSTPSGRTAWTSWSTGDWNYWEYASTLEAPVSRWGQRVCTQAQMRDRAGLLSTWSAQRCAETPYDQEDIAASYVGTWSQQVRSWATDGSYRVTKGKGASVTLDRTLTVRRVGIVASTGPDGGRVAIYVGSTKVGSLSLARSTTTAQRLLLLPTLASPLTGKVRVVVTSESGKAVRLDGIAVSAA